MAGLQPAGADLTAANRQLVREKVTSFYAGLPDSDRERREAGVAAATEICDHHRTVSQSVSIEDIRRGGDAADQTSRRLTYAVGIVNEQTEETVPRRPADRVSEPIGSVSKYVPLIGSYDRLATAACTVKRNETTRSLERFYLAAMVFAVEAVLIQQNVFYQPAFRVTGVATNAARYAGLYRLRYLCGNRCFALGMSEVYAVTYGTFVGAATHTAQTAGEMGLQLHREDVDWAAVASAQGAKLDRVLDEHVPDDVDGDRLVDCSVEAVGDGAEKADGVVDSVAEGEVGSVVDGLGEAGGKAEDTVDDCSDGE
jgi:hypothetical protein